MHYLQKTLNKTFTSFPYHHKILKRGSFKGCQVLPEKAKHRPKLLVTPFLRHSSYVQYIIHLI